MWQSDGRLATLPGQPPQFIHRRRSEVPERLLRGIFDQPSASDRTMILESVRVFYDRVIRIAEWIVAGRFATAKIALVSLAVGLFFSFPNHYGLSDKEAGQSWVGVLEKCEDPFLDMTTRYDPSVHESKLNFRLTVPIVAKLLGLGRRGILALHAISDVLLLWVCASLFARITSDRVSALFMTVGVASTWAGITGIVEFRGMFDVEALLFLACAALARGPAFSGLFSFLAAWTDERGLIASSMVYLYHVYQRYDTDGDRLSAFFTPAAMGVVISWFAYFATRYALARTYHITTPIDGTGVRTLIDQVNNLPMGTWTALEGGWLLVLASAFVLVKRRHFLFLTAFAGSLSIIIVVSMSVFDITRSMAYALPAIFIALEVLQNVETARELRTLCIIASTVSLVWPNYYAEYRSSIFWYTPFPLRVLKWLGV
jgi:hypothetical protein